MESIDKLRSVLKSCRHTEKTETPFDTYWNTTTACDMLIDDIEQELADRYMELPQDADGVPIRVGDIIEFGEKGERLAVTHIGWTRHGDPTVAYRRPNGTLDCSCIGAECRHAKPRTVEDVLRDCCNEWNEHCGNDWEQGVVARYADELRELMEVDR